MTVNIALKTSDALVFGCDSVASTTEFYLDPFKVEWEKDQTGKSLVDANGKFSVKFEYNNLEPLVTNAWGGVTKMFEVHPPPSPMVAVTAGLAKLKNRPIASLAAEFFAVQKNRQRKLVNCDKICKEFLKFMRRKFEEHYETFPRPEALQEGPEFLVGGYGRDDEFPSLFRVSVRQNDIMEHFEKGESGVAWNGQSDAVERFIQGCDGFLSTYVSAAVAEQLKNFYDAVERSIADHVNGLLDALDQKLPNGFQLSLPDLPAIHIDWRKYQLAIDYANLPRQDAVNFVAFLVNLQAAKGRFAQGVATVGGRTHVGVVTKEGFRVLNEPELSHKQTGFGDEI